MRYGILAHTFGQMACSDLAQKVGSAGFTFVQLALSKAISDIDTGLGKLSPGLANYVAEQFDNHGVRIGVLGCYINPIHPDPEQRRREINRFKEHLRYARDFGTGMVATETGKVATYLAEHPDSTEETRWVLLREAIEELAEEAEKWGVTLGIEASGSEVINTPDLMFQMLQEVPSSNIGVVFDPVNYLNANKSLTQRELFQKAFDQYGERIVLVHVKDLLIDAAGKQHHAAMGKGSVDYPFLLEWLQQHKPYVDLCFEGSMKESEMPAALQHMEQLRLHTMASLI
jgi:sugar phosphate isomerase/epimerase